MNSNQVISANCRHFLHNSPHGQDIFQIQPDKFTFLKSNLLVSNIVNNSLRKQKKLSERNQVDFSSAYKNCQVEMKKMDQQDKLKKETIERVKQLVKCNSQITLKEITQQQKTIHENIQKIYILRKQMNQKAAQIMARNTDSTYLGRELQKDKRTILNQLKDINPVLKAKKLSKIRLLMKDTANKINMNQLKQTLQQLTNLSIIKHRQNAPSFDNSQELSFQDTESTKSLDKQIENVNTLKRLIKSGSNKNFIQQQKRRAVWDGFSQHWKKEGEKHEKKRKELKKKAVNKISKHEFQDLNHEVLKYDDNYSRFKAMKKYQNAFLQTSSSFQLKLRKNQ